jgi:HAE1 family hydrophobic/amphiphilic exporter-1
VAFQFQLQDRRGNESLDPLLQALGQILGQANQPGPDCNVCSVRLRRTRLSYLVEVDRNKAKALQVSIDDIFNTLQTLLGSQYVNDFNLQQRTYRVYVQADSQFRSNPEDINNLYVRSATRSDDSLRQSGESDTNHWGTND